jgi:hypothetical protein
MCNTAAASSQLPEQNPPTHIGYAGNGDCKGEGQRQNFDLAGRPSAGPAKDASLATVSDTRTDNISQ